MRDICDRCGDGTKILYDAAHVAGLIFGGRFQNPWKKGADMFTPQAQISLSVESTMAWWHGMTLHIMQRVEHALVPLFTSNHHAQEVASVAVTLAENVDFGEEYADQVVRNLRHRNKAPYENGVDIVAAHKGFSESHMVLARIGDHANKVKDALERANIILQRHHMPEDGGDRNWFENWDRRMTRMGMTEDVMTYAGEFNGESYQ